MDKKLNPLDGEIDLLGDTVSDIIRKLNPLTGRLELVYSADSYIQKINPFIGDFDIVGGTGASYIIKEVTGNGYINLTNAVANHLMELKAYGGTVNRDIPVGYTQLDYITLNKGYFDTGITPTTDTDYELKFTIAQINTTQGVMGMLNNSTPANNFYFMVSSGNKFLSALGTSATTLTGLADAVADTDYLVKVNGETLTVNGVAASNFNRGTLEATQTIDLGCRKNSENNGLTGKLYYFKIWKGGKLVAHYIPCKRNSDDVLGYYDIVNDTFGVLLTSYGTPEAGSSTLTPTPDTPVALTCNNGIIKVRHQSGLPTGYKLLQSIRNNSSATLDTGIQLANTDVIEMRFFNNSDSGFGAWYGIYASGENTAFYANQTYYGYDGSNSKVNTNVAVDTLGHDVVHDFVNGKLTLDGVDTTFTPFEFTNTINNKLFCRYYGGSYGYNVKGWICYFRVKRNGVLIQNLIPCTRESDNTVGMYDLVSGIFIGPDEGYTFEEGTAATDPLEIHTDGTTETIEDELGNTATAEMLLKVGDYADEQEILSGNITRKIGIRVLTGDNTKDGLWGTSAGASNLYSLSISNSSTDNTFSPISTHFVGILGSVGYASIQNGQFKHGSNSYTYFFKDTNSADVTAFKTYLAAQYANGTPVIIIYPLATPTTESVTGQTIDIQDGSNTIEITQASIDNLGLYAKYKATA